MSANPDPHWAPTAPFEEEDESKGGPEAARDPKAEAPTPSEASMYAPHFGLKHEPFSIAPDPRYLFMSERHREALAHLLYGVGGGGGFVLLTGEIGAGKTTVCRCFLEQIPAHTHVAYIFNPKLTVIELLQTICEEFRIPFTPERAAGASVKDYVDRLNAFLLKAHAQGHNSVLIIDEAQNLSADVLEQLRLLTNLETSERKLLQIILIGQPELRDMLEQPELEQLAQRVIARYHLAALSEAETAQYIRHRLAVAGMKRPNPFERQALGRIHELTRGVPRRINLLCSRALLGAYAGDRNRVDVAIVEQAAREVFGKRRVLATATSGRPWPVAARAGLGAGAAALLLGLAWWGWTAMHPAKAGTAAGPAKAASAVPGRRSASAGGAAASVAAPVRGAITGPLLADDAQAWRELAALWHVRVADGQDACALDQLQCFRHADMTLAQIRQLDRPGWLSLRLPDGSTGRALLVGLGPRAAMLRVGDTPQIVSLAALAAAWHGDFATYWRPPPGYARPADLGTAAVQGWLDAQLARWAGAAGAAGGDLKSRIAAFQTAEGLPADGLAGPMTFMQLDRALGVAEPRLQSAP
jgi:general secretion pathway protein A